MVRYGFPVAKLQLVIRFSTGIARLNIVSSFYLPNISKVVPSILKSFLNFPPWYSLSRRLFVKPHFTIITSTRPWPSKFTKQSEHILKCKTLEFFGAMMMQHRRGTVCENVVCALFFSDAIFLSATTIEKEIASRGECNRRVVNKL